MVDAKICPTNAAVEMLTRIWRALGIVSRDDPIDTELEDSSRRLSALYRRKGDLETAEHFELIAERIATTRTKERQGDT